MKKPLESFLESRKREIEGRPETLPTLEELKNEYVEYLLDRTFQNKSETARILQISRTALYYRIAVHQIGGSEDNAWLNTGHSSSH